MDEPKITFGKEFDIKFGDKIFVYGQFMNSEKWEEYGLANPIYNSVMGYEATGGYLVYPRKSHNSESCLPGFVMEVDFLSGPSLPFPAPFAAADWIDITGSLSLQAPYMIGSRVWMPISY